MIEGLVYRTIAERRRASHPGDDLLGMFLAATDPDGGEAMSDRQLRDELLTVLGAGQETTAILLAWSWWLLVEHPEIEARLRHEVEHALAGRVPTAADVPALAYVRMFVAGSPAALPAGVGHHATVDRGGRDRRLPHSRRRAGVARHLLHPSSSRASGPIPRPSIPSASRRPRGGRPSALRVLSIRRRSARSASASSSALLEATLTIAMVCQRYRFRLVPGRPVEPWIQIALRPRNGVRMTLADADGSHPAAA